ncbi:MAG: acyltransferase family protein, partial [Polyangiaceae bacterium]
ISSILFAEIQKSGTLSLAKFYFRRAFRIFPAFYAYVIAMAAAASWGYVALRPGDVLHALSYTTNYHYDRAWTMGHTWSLSVEEQFYLLWPVTLLALGKKGGLQFAAVLVLAAPVIRVATLVLHLGPVAGIGETFQTVGDSIAVGCVLAGYQKELHAWPRYRRLLDSSLFFLVPVVGVLACTVHHHPKVAWSIGEPITNVCIALTVDRCILHSDGPVGRVLNWGPLAYVGTLSYSLYLWQQPFLEQSSTVPFLFFPVNVALAFVTALLSYYLVERPCLLWRERLEPKILGGQRSAVTSTAG